MINQRLKIESEKNPAQKAFMIAAKSRFGEVHDRLKRKDDETMLGEKMFSLFCS